MEFKDNCLKKLMFLTFSAGSNSIKQIFTYYSDIQIYKSQ